MANFWKGFAQTFRPEYAIADVIRFLHQDKLQKQNQDFQIQERQREEQLAQQQRTMAYDLASGEQPDILGQILGQPQVPFTGTSRILTPDQQRDILKKLDTTGLNYYNVYNKFLNPKPKEQKAIKEGDTYYRPLPGFSNVPNLEDPITSVPQEFKPKTILNWELTRYVDGKLVIPKGYYDENKKWVETDFKTIAPMKKGKKDDGQDYSTLAPGTKEILKAFFNKQQNLKGIVGAGLGGVDASGTEIFDESFGKDEEGNVIMPKTDYDQALVNHNAKYSTVVDNIMSESAQDWYKGLQSKFGEEPTEEYYLANLKSAYTNSQLDEADFVILVEKFKALYGFNPLDRYGTNLEKLPSPKLKMMKTY